MTSRLRDRAGQRRQVRFYVHFGEWIGGVITIPYYVTKPAPYRPEMMLWVELPEGFVVGTELIDPDEPAVSIGEVLSRTIRSPIVGQPRRPARVSVGNRQLQAEIRAAEPEIEIVVAPTPEVNDFLDTMTEMSTMSVS